MQMRLIFSLNETDSKYIAFVYGLQLRSAVAQYSSILDPDMLDK